MTGGALHVPPFHALAVALCMRFPFGGPRVHADGRVVDRDGSWVRNLYAAGADAGGPQGPAHLGGLIAGLVFGAQAAEADPQAVRGSASAVCSR